MLLDAHLKLHEGRHYVLIGRNGTGKTSLLQCVHEQRIPGISFKLRTLLVSQTGEPQEVDSKLHDLSLSDVEETTLQHVIRRDAQRQRLLQESTILTKALEQSTDALAPVSAFRKLKHQRYERALEEASSIAARRSGARGWEARKVLNEMEAQMVELTALLHQPEREINAETIEAETRGATEMLDEVQTLLQDNSSLTAESRARSILLGLRFPADKVDAPFVSLSGGWRTRCELASTLFMRSDILMLDEPTNYLDLPAVIWLQGYIESLSKTTVLVVTHDRDFADAIAEELIVLREQKLEYFDGNLTEYEKERSQQIRRMTKMKEASDRKSAHISKTIEQNVQAAKRTGDDKRLKQAASRKKKLEERTGLEIGLKGGRFKLNRDLGGYHTTMRAAIEIPTMDPAVRISLPDVSADLRFPGALLSIERVSFKYPGAKDCLLKDIDLTVHAEDRIGIAGLNGAGKTTLIRLALSSTTEGDNRGLKPTSGVVQKHPRARIGWFSQHAVEELKALGRDHAGPTPCTALSHFLDVTDRQLGEQDTRALLSSLGLHGKVVSDVPLSLLSGGQLVRLALAKLVWSPPHLLILDEVTTHLDADTVVALIGALKAYNGAVLVVTHDRFFMRCVVEGERVYQRDEDDDDDESDNEDGEKVREGVVYRIARGRLVKLEGGMRQYEEIATKTSKKSGGG